MRSRGRWSKVVKCPYCDFGGFQIVKDVHFYECTRYGRRFKYQVDQLTNIKT